MYDALNVLMAMDIISKEKKEIRWRGLPSNSTMQHYIESLLVQKADKADSIRGKEARLRDLRQHVSCPALLRLLLSSAYALSSQPHFVPCL